MRSDRLWKSALVWIASATTSLGAPEISLPVNAQVPPLARVSEDFRYQFADTTFTSQDPSSLVYSLSGAPTWLQLDSSTRTFSGTPSSQDLGSLNFLLNAADSTGATGMHVTFIVVNSPAPGLGINLSNQLEKYGSLSENTSLEYYSNQAFNVVLTPDIFQGETNTTYYATSANGSPLPSWLKFDPGSVTFSGLTPTPVNSPEVFGIAVSVSNTPGFSDASIQFDFVISDHKLLFSPYEQSIEISGANSLSFTSLKSQLMLDGEPITESQISSSQAQIPSWMQYNSQTLAISGNPPPGLRSQDVTVTVNDEFGDTASTLLHFHFESLVFRSEIGTLDARIGSSFTYHIDRSIFTNPGVNVTLNVGSMSSWLKFDESDLTLHGIVPRTLRPTEEQLSITASLPSSSITESQSFQIRILPSQSPDTTHTTSSESSQWMTRPTRVQTTHATSRASTPAKGHSLTGNQIAAIIIISTVAVVVTLLILIFRLGQRRNNRTRGWNASSEKPRKSQIVPRRERAEPNEGLDVEGGGQGNKEPYSRPPQLPGNIEGIGSSIRSSKYQCSNTSQIMQGEVDPGSKVGQGRGRKEARSSKQVDKAGQMMVVSEKDLVDHVAQKRQSGRPSRSSLHSSGLPVERRLTGLGHGRSSYASQSRIFGSLIRSHGDTDSSSLASYSTISIQRKIDSFPSAPRGPERSSRLPGQEQDMAWIRKVSGDLNEDDSPNSLTVPDQRPLEERRQSFIRWRASKGRSANPFSSGSNYGQRRRQPQQPSGSPSLVIKHANRAPRVQSGCTLSSAGASEGWETADGSSIVSAPDDVGEEEEDPSELPSSRAVHEQHARWSRRLRGSKRNLRDEVRPHALLSPRRPRSVLTSRPLRSQIASGHGPDGPAASQSSSNNADETAAFI